LFRTNLERPLERLPDRERRIATPPVEGGDADVVPAPGGD